MKEKKKINEVKLIESSGAKILPFLIAGIGASAGGLKAFEEFFSAIPPNTETNMAFVLIQHLAPTHKSILAELIQRHTTMKVFEVENGMTVKNNCIYIIPPNYYMSILNGVLYLERPILPHGLRLPIDFFFRSLAESQHHLAVGILLSGTGSDGTLGIRAIKGELGMVIAQFPASCEFDGMPLSAIQTGLVDYQLIPAKMPAQLKNYADHISLLISKDQDPSPPDISYNIQLHKIFTILSTYTGHDFSQYKQSTILRRIERRMVVQDIKTIDKYVLYLNQMPEEQEALFRDMLIGVTNFFRDPDIFKELEEKIIPKLFNYKASPGGVIRIWSIGCSTGEEAYSLAILLHEHMNSLKQSYIFQIFATDIDNNAIAIARTGVYSTNISLDISPERLNLYFTLDQKANTYRINKNIRDMLIFSEQNVIKDPPFSKLDLICCRNLLIYFDSDLQKKLIPLFHYALNPNGFLFLGSSEGIGEFEDIFTPIDRKIKIYQRKENYYGIKHTTFNQNLITQRAFHSFSNRPTPAQKPPLREITEQALLNQIAIAAVLVDKQGDIFYLHGRTGMYLEPTQGEVTVNNIINMAREGLRSSLSLDLKKAATTGEMITSLNIRVKTNGHYTQVNLYIRPIKIEKLDIADTCLYLVILEQAPVSIESTLPPITKDSVLTNSSQFEKRITILENEIKNKDLQLQNSHQDLQSSSEELKSSNEEMQSINEELQSTNEELETSKEELQSVNEELATVNSELNAKVYDLTRVNNDMNNLLAGSGIATIFVDLKLNILRYTPSAAQIINLIPTDVGRPVSHIVSNLENYQNLIQDTQEVLDSLIPKNLEVKTYNGWWFSMRIRPYRTIENIIEGAVITFIDISERKKFEGALSSSIEQINCAIKNGKDAIIVQKLDGQTLAWNRAAAKMYGWSESEALSINIQKRLPEHLREGALAKLLELSQADILESYKTQRMSKDGTILDIWMIASPLINNDGEIYAIATTERIIGGAVAGKK